MRLGYIGQDEAPAAYVDTRPWYIRARDWLADSTVVNAAAAARDYTLDEAQQAIQALYTAGVNFDQTMSDLLNAQANVASVGDPDLQSQYDDLVSRGSSIKGAISTAVNSVQSIVAWIKQNLGVDIGQGANPPAGLQGLGIIQLVPLALLGAVVAATALATAWIVDARSAITKIQALTQLANSVPPDQRASVVNNALKQSGGIAATVSSVNSFLIIAAVIAAGVFFAPQLKRLIK
jgi:hypothetical protein